ncbi:hypothetical protein [Romboutsia sp.]|uniref:hypothetical protein n=1 Tax=Romboutsia sp. TaxID=1965302 RepID=UPI002C9A49B5|nr:hypothetical protein [Romboutsia sp.]HSQ88686.1 hypothetical protein [Romboutsia sp.]
MKLKKEGFITIECIISISIICMGIHIISTCLYNSYCSINYNKEQFEMLNIANSKIEETKYSVKNNRLSTLENNYTIENEYGYTVNTIVEKDRYYYQCYKVNVDVSNGKNNIKLKSYVLQQ